ncbi:MAG: hypothetical protein ACRDT0_25525 [Pseudonocardiaceae bacterium]
MTCDGFRGLDPDLLVWFALRRARRGGVTTLGGRVPGVRWVLSPVDSRARVLAKPGDNSLGVWIARVFRILRGNAGL